MLAALVLLVLLADPVLHRLGAPALAARAVVDLTELFASALAALAFARRALHTLREDPRGPSSALGWAAFAGACGAWSLGQVVWSAYELLLRREPPTPSLADAGFLGFTVLAPVATLLLAQAGLRPLSRLRALLDGVIVAGALLVVSWMLVLKGVLASGATSRLPLAVNLAYPLGDVLVLAVVVVVMSRTRPSLGLALLSAGAGLLAVSDSAFVGLSASGGFATGGVTDAGWTAAFVTLAAAAVVGTGPAAAPRRGWTSRSGLFVPYAPLLVCGALLLRREVEGTADVQAFVGSAALVLAVLARQGLLVLENHRLVEQLHQHAGQLRVMASTDPLTGVANRLGFTQRLEELVATGRPITAAFADLDRFKAVNDRCGHAVGDALLVAVARRLREAVREGDVIARLGGDEFAVLATGEQGADGPTLSQRLQEALAAPLSLAPEVVAVLGDGAEAGDAAVLEAVTVSLGVVCGTEVAGGAEDVLHLADQRMYEAKRARAALRDAAGAVRTPVAAPQG